MMHRLVIFALIPVIVLCSQAGVSWATVLQVDLDSGTMIWVNPSSASPLGFAAYSITEKNGGLVSDNPENWWSLTDNYDSDNGGSVDPINAWAIFDNHSENRAEGTFGTAWLVPGQRINLGDGAWDTASLQEDLSFEYLNEQSQVIEGQIDFGHFDLHTADFDEDGDIDGNDFLAWQVGFGTASSAPLSAGDADANSQVDSADFTVWQSQFGTTTAASGATLALSSTAIPEPAAGVLAAFLAVALLIRIFHPTIAKTLHSIYCGITHPARIFHPISAARP